jgi:hypothetical protein
MMGNEGFGRWIAALENSTNAGVSSRKKEPNPRHILGNRPVGISGPQICREYVTLNEGSQCGSICIEKCSQYVL